MSNFVIDNARKLSSFVLQTNTVEEILTFLLIPEFIPLENLKSTF